MEIVYKHADSRDTLPLRKRVFEIEQGFTDDVDNIDDIAWHIAFVEDGVTIACSRIFCEENDGNYHAGRIAVKKSRRGEGLGFKMMEIIKGKAEELGAAAIILSSQLHAANFYEKCGYVRQGKVYLDQDSPHVDMILKL